MATLREKLDKFINHPVVDGVVMVLITVSVVLTIAEFTRDTHPHDALWIANEILTVVFIVGFRSDFMGRKAGDPAAHGRIDRAGRGLTLDPQGAFAKIP